MNKQEKFIVLNEITNYTFKLSERLEHLKDSIKFGLHKGKLASLDDIALYCGSLIEAIDKYQDDSFKLDDIQDYKSGFEK